MSVEVSAAVWKCDAVTKHSELLLLLALADWSNDSGESWYSIGNIAAKCRASHRTIQYMISSLEKRGLLAVERATGGAYKNTNVYRINLAKLGKQGCKACTGADSAPVQKEGGGVQELLHPRGAIAVAPNTSYTSEETSLDARKARTKAKRAKSKSPDQEQEPSEFRQFIADWCEAFEAQWGTRYDFKGGRDAKAVKQLLESKGKSPAEVLQIATDAWSRLKQGYLRDQSVTLHGLNNAWSQIVTNLKGAPAGNGASKSNSMSDADFAAWLSIPADELPQN